jgi:hypothetical protein
MAASSEESPACQECFLQGYPSRDRHIPAVFGQADARAWSSLTGIAQIIDCPPASLAALPSLAEVRSAPVVAPRTPVAHDDRGGRARRSEDRLHPGAEAVRLAVDGVALDGDLARPSSTAGMVLFAHGSGSSRHSPRNRRIADRFDIGLLARRLLGAIDWLAAHFGGGQLRVGLFGASTGAAAALVAAAERPSPVAAFEEPGALEEIARRAAAWFVTYLRLMSADPSVG